SRFAPLAEKRGLRLLGAYAHALVPDVGLNLWVLPSWDRWRELMEAEPRDREWRDWHDGLGEWLVDLDGLLVVPPPPGALRTGTRRSTCTRSSARCPAARSPMRPACSRCTTIRTATRGAATRPARSASSAPRRPRARGPA